MKKLSSILLALLLMLQVLPVQAARGYRSLWIECEDVANVLSGDWVASADGNASGKSSLKLDTKKAEPHEVTINFNLSYEDDYDIFLLGTPGNDNWCSVRKWKLNDGEYQSDQSTRIATAYVTGDSRGAGLSWFKLSSQKLSKGNCSLSFYADQFRTMSNDFCYSVLDVIAVVPSSWEWTPNGISTKPYNKNNIKLNVASGSVSKKSLAREEEFTVDVQYRLGAKTDGMPLLYAELALNGETVSRQSHTPTTPLKTWGEGMPQTESFTLAVPFNVPDGEFEIRAGVEDLTLEDGSKDAVIDTVTIGNGVAEEVVPVKAEFTSMEIPESIKKDEPFNVSASFTLNREIGKPAKPYIAFWKDGLLYEVLTGSGQIDEQKGSFEFSTTLTSDLPEGSYEVKPGIHYANSDTNVAKTVAVSGTDSMRSKYHKPLSYGNYYSKETGREQLWYINQNSTAIWNGEPYIPIGGMFVSQYIYYYSVGNDAANKANFAQDVEDLEKIRASGVDDLYFNPVRANDIPNWAWKYLFDYLEENGWYYGLQGTGANYVTVNSAEQYFPHATELSGRFEVKNVTKSGAVTLTTDRFTSNIADTRSALFVAVNDETGKIVDSGICELMFDPDGKILFKADVKLENDSAHTVYFTPKTYGDVSRALNYWENPESYDDTHEKYASTFVAGDNMRLFVDPTCNEMGFYNDNEVARIADEKFNKLFIEWLKKQYSSVAELNASWKTTPAVTSFEEAVELIPLYTSAKDEKNNSYSIFVNDKTGAAYTVDTHSGAAWNDYLDARDDTFLDFNNRVADNLKKYVDIPVIYKHCSVQRRYFINKNEVGGFDGMGSETYGATAKMSRAAAMTGSMLDQMTRTGWQVITETNTEENMIGKYESGEWSYPSEEDLFERFSGMMDAGAKGIYDFLLQDRPDLGGKLGTAYSWISNPDTIEWGSRFSEMVDKNIDKYANERAAEDKFYFYPAHTNWWRSLNERTAVQLGDDMMRIVLLRTKNGSGNHVSQTDSLDVDSRLIFVNIQDGPNSNVFGPELSKLLQNQPADKRICVIGHRNDLGTIPEVDKYFTNEKVVIDSSTNETVQILNPTSTSTVLMTTDDGKPWALKDGELYIVASDKIVVENELEGHLRYVDELGITDVSSLKGAKGEASVGFADMVGHWAEKDVNYMKTLGIASGIGDNQFAPEANVTVSEFVALVTRTMGLNSTSGGDTWYSGVMSLAEENGLITENMKNNPERNITREEMAYISAKASKFEENDFDLSAYSDYNDIDESMQNEVKIASKLGLVYGMTDGTFRPKETATRAQAVVIVKRLLQM